MKTPIYTLALLLITLPFTAHASVQSQINKCKNAFADRLATSQKLRFFCTEGNAGYTNTDFIALQLSSSDNDRVTLICEQSPSGAAVLTQANYLLANTGLLHLVGSEVDQDHQDFYLSKLNPSVRESLKNAQCFDAKGRILAD